MTQPPPCRWPKEEFLRWIEEALERLPEEFKRLVENVELVVIERLSPEEAEELDLDEDVLAYYEGQPLSERGLGHGLPPYHGVLPDRVVFIQANLEALCRSERELKREIFDTVVHELAHYFGISDERIEELGLD